MIVRRMQPHGRATIPAEVCAALGLSAGDTIRYEIDGDQVIITKASRDDEHGDDDLFTDAELDPIIDAALASAGQTYSAEEVFGELHARLDQRRGRRDAA